MYLGPKLRERFGNWARISYWAVTIVLMVALANFALIGLRQYVNANSGELPEIWLELWFIAVAVASAGTLIFRRLNR